MKINQRTSIDYSVRGLLGPRAHTPKEDWMPVIKTWGVWRSEHEDTKIFPHRIHYESLPGTSTVIQPGPDAPMLPTGTATTFSFLGPLAPRGRRVRDIAWRFGADSRWPVWTGLWPNSGRTVHGGVRLCKVEGHGRGSYSLNLLQFGSIGKTLEKRIEVALVNTRQPREKGNKLQAPGTGVALAGIAGAAGAGCGIAEVGWFLVVSCLHGGVHWRGAPCTHQTFDKSIVALYNAKQCRITRQFPAKPSQRGNATIFGKNLTTPEQDHQISPERGLIARSFDLSEYLYYPLDHHATY
ncbi:hypothetical protein B0H16DRAFT_1454983 [Mycena metata]|uniref:Uncharacterized protein n=1 Tax=Mycena metata TaxID=1033252 RepID=A0AAD7JFH9_9AGAR|nr:hypothetical protein B0H16DRAFT_1454983 [Mycena metata]